MEYPYLTQDRKDSEPTPQLLAEEKRQPIQYIRNIKDGTMIGYKYFDFQGVKGLKLSCRGKAKGRFAVRTEAQGDAHGEIPVDMDSADWTQTEAAVEIPDGIHALYLEYSGEGAPDMVSFSLCV